MTFRTVVRDGLIVINTHGALPDGTPVEVLPARPKPAAKARGSKATRKTPARAKARRASARPAKDPLDGFFGVWKDRPDWKGKTTLEIARELRLKAMGRGPRG